MGFAPVLPAVPIHEIAARAEAVDRTAAVMASTADVLHGLVGRTISGREQF